MSEPNQNVLNQSSSRSQQEIIDSTLETQQEGERPLITNSEFGTESQKKLFGNGLRMGFSYGQQTYGSGLGGASNVQRPENSESSSQQGKCFSSATSFSTPQTSSFENLQASSAGIPKEDPSNRVYSHTLQGVSLNHDSSANKPAGITRGDLNLQAARAGSFSTFKRLKDKVNRVPVPIHQINPFARRSNIQYFQEIALNPYPYPIRSRTYDLKITLETNTHKADTLIIVNQKDKFLVSSSILKQKCNFLSDQDSDQSQFSLKFPFSSMVYDVLFYLTYNNYQKLMDKVNYLHDVLELYIVLKEFKVKNTSTILESLYHKPLNNNIDIMNQLLPDTWNKAYIDFEFVINFLEKSSIVSSVIQSRGFSRFGYPLAHKNDNFILMLFSWLGYNNITHEEQITRLFESQETPEVMDYLEIKRIFPINPQIYMRRMPRVLELLQTYRI